MATADAPPAALRAASYNVHRAVGLDRRRDVGRTAAAVEELDADVVGLQEVDWRRGPHEAAATAEALSRLPGYVAIEGPNLEDHRGRYGNLLLVRGEVETVRRIDLAEPGREPRGAIDADVRLRGRRLRVFVTHLGLAPLERRRQALRLAEALAEGPQGPALILGDFNEWIPWTPTLRPLLSLCARGPSPASFPAWRPFLALDRILMRGMPAPGTVRVHAGPSSRRASDHLPVVAEFGAGVASRDPAEAAATAG